MKKEYYWIVRESNGTLWRHENNPVLTENGFWLNGIAKVSADVKDGIGVTFENSPVKKHWPPPSNSMYRNFKVGLT
jgi:hypothetical protein